ncbi:uncharacterized protein LOC125187550 [Salvia hispanica]|uniref:uncharacterized protein LOC125187550 n=1 Tax=Salvia hispanica TaxID=49212 RepID=UPI002008F857|nr:uncharacterized protein LOC125187550 [Salvia hispanica]
MAVAVEANPTPKPKPKPKPSLRVCFSYAAYAKNVVHYLHSSNIPVAAALSDAEFAAVESAFRFSFPPDLRSILQEGLPVGPGFPNWRSSSRQQLEILTTLPVLGICKEVSRNNFWLDSWGLKPPDPDRAASLAKAFLKKAPLLVPIYRNFYIPSAPCAAGNPVFYVHGTDVRVWSFDIAGFFQKVEFGMCGEAIARRRRVGAAAPAWAAREGRRVEFWTEMAERRGGWWSGELGGCLEEVCWRLRDGGWKEEDVREMMMIDGCDGSVDGSMSMSERMLRAGWSTEDVVDLLGFPNRNGVDDGDYSKINVGLQTQSRQD